jgi:carboxyl-terminal processing protease
MNFWRSLVLLCLGVVIGVSGSGVTNFFANTLVQDSEVPTIGSDAELVAWLRRKVKELDKQTCSERYRKFEDIYKILWENYYSTSGVKFEQLLEGGLHGFVGGLKDPHTVYFDKQENDDFSKDLKGSYDFEWIGAVIGQASDQIIIMEVIKESPAHKAWLRPLDTVLQIDNISVEGKSVREVVEQVRGPKWTKVELTILTDKDKKIMKVSVMRDKIIIPGIVSKSLKVGTKTLGYISIATIGEDTAIKFKESYTQLIASGAQWFIIDLRGNGWGILPIANEIASYFVPKGKIVTITRYKSKHLPEEIYYSKWYGKANYPVVVLMDELSASASEILAYALQYQIGAKLIGTTTFGKGTIQTLYTLPDNSSIKFTIGKWFTPDDLNIDKSGIKPDYEVKFDPKLFEDKQIDNQLEKAKEVLSGKIKN